MGEKDGAFRTTIEGVVSRTDAGSAGAAQVELFDDVGEPDLQPPAGWDAPSSVSGLPVGERGRRGGRPKGALNKRSLDLARFFQAKYRDPAAVLGELVSRDPLELWLWICKKDPEGAPPLKDVIALQAAVARDLMPYLHAKRPVQVETGRKLPVFVVPGLGETIEEAIDGVLRLDDEIDDVG